MPITGKSIAVTEIGELGTTLDVLDSPGYACHNPQVGFNTREMRGIADMSETEWETKSEQERGSVPRLVRIKDGWAAHGPGWAVHGATAEDATSKYHEMETLLARIAQRPYWRELQVVAQLPTSDE